MKIVKLGTRDSQPAFFDMTGRFKPAGDNPWYGSTFRIGDKAVIFGQMRNWRDQHPADKLTIVTDPNGHETAWSRQIPNDWVFGGIADELWEADYADEKLKLPPGAPLYTENIFASWRKLKEVEPMQFRAHLPRWDVNFTAELLQQLQVPEEFVTVHPLFDACYDVHRNGKIAWWYDVIRELAKAVHVVVIGDYTAMSKFPQLPPGTTSFWKAASTPMQSLCVLERSKCHVGGDTGMTLWASLFRTPVAAAYAYWDKPWKKNADRGMDTRPISCGQPVQHMPLHGDPFRSASLVLRLLG